jgi:hypothetical protein
MFVPVKYGLDVTDNNCPVDMEFSEHCLTCRSLEFHECHFNAQPSEAVLGLIR